MTAITIPAEVTKGEELIVIPRRLYEQFLRAFKKQSTVYTKSILDVELAEALEDVKKGRMIGPFSSLNEGLKALKNIDI